MSSNQEKREQSQQQLLDQIKDQQETIEALSDEELGSVAGGILMNMNTGMVHNSNMTGGVRPNATLTVVHNSNMTGGVVPNATLTVAHAVNTGAVIHPLGKES